MMGNATGGATASPRARGKRRVPSGARSRIVAVDLFCGAGGLTHGLEGAGVDVRLGIDHERRCEAPYTLNNAARFRAASVADVTGDDLRAEFGDAPYRLLAGCAPCQPFSTYTRSRKLKPGEDGRWGLLHHFGRLVTDSDANLVTMENVTQISRESVFSEFVASLERAGFHVDHREVECTRYGIPQSRRRLVLLASRLGPIRLREPDGGRPASVRDAIGHLPPLQAGDRDADDPLHACAKLSPVNLDRIKASTPGGTWRDWPPGLVAGCHAKETGKTYPAVYGRMTWDDPSPTITTQYFGFGNGRFGHPEQDRAISLREGAILQSFPADYRFSRHGEPVEITPVGKLIGNAVPVALGRAIGDSFRTHVEEHACRATTARPGAAVPLPGFPAHA